MGISIFEHAMIFFPPTSIQYLEALTPRQSSICGKENDFLFSRGPPLGIPGSEQDLTLTTIQTTLSVVWLSVSGEYHFDQSIWVAEVHFSSSDANHGMDSSRDYRFSLLL